MTDKSNTSWCGALAGLGPGILFAGAAIGVSHLVQSTRAGAGYGFGLLWAVVLVFLFKYPFFEYAHRYTIATGESLLTGYRRLGRWAMILFMMVVVASSFITLAAGLALLWDGAEYRRRVLGLGAMALLVVLALGVITLFMHRMKMLIDLVTVLAFLTAPVVALLNFKVVRSALVPQKLRPGKAMVWLSWAGITFLTGFSLVWIWLRWLA